MKLKYRQREMQNRNEMKICVFTRINARNLDTWSGCHFYVIFTYFCTQKILPIKTVCLGSLLLLIKLLFCFNILLIKTAYESSRKRIIHKLFIL